MPKRGSVQLLLLSLCPCATLGLGLGAAVFILLASLALFREDFPLLDKAGIAQALRQSAWEHALADQSQPARWPWENLSENMSLAPSGNVPRLGLSASVLKQFADVPELPPQPRTADHANGGESAALGDIVIGDATIGDSITFTAADGATCIYRITGRPVVDPHLAEAEAQRSDGGSLLLSCGPLDRLIMRATREAQDEPPVVPAPGNDQHKL